MVTGGFCTRVPTRFVSKYTLRARLEPSGSHEAVERGTGYARVPGDGGFGHAQLEDGEALAAHVLRRGRDPPRGDDFHGLSMKCGFGCFIGQIRNMKRVLFQAAELFGQNVRLCLTAPCRTPTPTSSRPRLMRNASFLEADRREITLRRRACRPRQAQDTRALACISTRIVSAPYNAKGSRPG